ncbi:MAG: protein tyrosine phosphatase family protein [Phycisphaeraceae bacterium]
MNIWTKRITLLSIASLLAIIAGCQTTSKQEHKAITTDKLEPYQCGDVAKLHTYKGVFLASQPSADDFAQAKKGGVKTVVNLRHESENKDFNEKQVVGDLGLAYHNVPWNGPNELTDAKFDEARKLLREAERPILMHCSSANRVGAMWLAYRVLDEGATVEEATAEAKTVGMMSPDFERIAKAYVAKNKK